MIIRLQKNLSAKNGIFSLSKSPNLVSFVKLCQKSTFSSRLPVFIISSVFRQKQNPSEPNNTHSPRKITEVDSTEKN